jgi:hypothetical protein
VVVAAGSARSRFSLALKIVLSLQVLPYTYTLRASFLDRAGIEQSGATAMRCRDS